MPLRLLIVDDSTGETEKLENVLKNGGYDVYHNRIETPAEMADASFQLAVTAAEQLSLSMANLKLQSALRQQSIQDALTGLFNRRYLDESLGRGYRLPVRR